MCFLNQNLNMLSLSVLVDFSFLKCVLIGKKFCSKVFYSNYEKP